MALARPMEATRGIPRARVSPNPAVARPQTSRPLTAAACTGKGCSSPRRARARSAGARPDGRMKGTCCSSVRAIWDSSVAATHRADRVRRCRWLTLTEPEPICGPASRRTWPWCAQNVADHRVHPTGRDQLSGIRHHSTIHGYPLESSHMLPPLVRSLRCPPAQPQRLHRILEEHGEPLSSMLDQKVRAPPARGRRCSRVPATMC